MARGDCIRESDLAFRNDGCLSSVLWKGHASDHPASFTPLPVAVAPCGQDEACAAVAAGAGSTHACPAPGACPVPGADQQSERERLIEAMETAGWVQAKAARILDLTPRQIGYALRKHGVEIKKF